MSLIDPLSHLVSRVELWPPLCPSSFLEQLRLGNPKGLEAGVWNETSPFKPLLPAPAPSLDLLREPETYVSTSPAREEAKALWPLPTPSKQDGCCHHPCSLPQKIACLKDPLCVYSDYPSHPRHLGMPPTPTSRSCKEPPVAWASRPPLQSPPLLLSLSCVLKTPLTLRSVRITQHLHSMLLCIP